MRRLLLVLSAIVFVDTTFYAVVAPLLPHYAKDLDLSKASAGVLLAAYPAGTLVGALPGGIFAVRFGPKRTVLAGLVLLGASSVGFAFASSALVLDLARFVQGVGGACSWAGGLAWLVGEAPAARRGELIGTALGAAVGGALLGPALGAAAAALGTRPVFGAVAAIAIGLGFAAAGCQGGQAGAEPGASLRHTLKTSRVRAGLWLVALPGLSFGVLDVLVPLRLDELGAGEAGVAATFLISAAVEGGMSPIVGRVADRRGALVPIRMGLLAATVIVLVVPIPQIAVLCALVMVTATAAFGAFWAPAMTLLSEAAERVGADQGLAFGLVNLAWALGMVGGAAGGGALAKATSDTLCYVLLAVLCGTTLAGLVRRRSRQIATSAR
ncbi:MAG TPA: MFS transporter [Baekduia sp.]|uniref:MFS transporter n=1 Tax=Baekduia sp. TaxID=2600305 RepID=UPI002D773E6C|nr:MFS transporter [Baekduia sp.]HET6505535.1 MFS transporter [Baekduia sp.]